MAYINPTEGLKEVKVPSDVPAQPHYQIVFFDKRNVYHEGDERSRTHPGHGYPAYTETINERKIFVTIDQDVWQKALKALYAEDQHRNDILAQEVIRKAKVQASFTIV